MLYPIPNSPNTLKTNANLCFRPLRNFPYLTFLDLALTAGSQRRGGGQLSIDDLGHSHTDTTDSCSPVRKVSVETIFQPLSIASLQDSSLQ
jgi:hypothetical protein